MPTSGKPKRIQRQRTKGWRMPEGAIYVGRPSRWGNPYRVEDVGREVAVQLFAEFWGALELARDARRELRGRDLVCWCALDRPCHADVLLELANG